MPDDGYILSADDVAILREVVSAYRRGGLTRPLQATGRTLPQAIHHYVAYTGAGGVPAMSSSIAGSADVSIATVSTSGLMAATTTTVLAYNMSGYAVSANTWIQVKREQLTGRFMVDVENCT